MFLEAGPGFARFKSLGGAFDGEVAENDGVDEAFDVGNGVFGQWGAQLISEAPAVD